MLTSLNLPHGQKPRAWLFWAGLVLVGLYAGTGWQSARAADKGVLVRVHGNAFVPADTLQLSIDGTRRNGWGSSFTAPAGTVAWFHVPLPVTVGGGGQDKPVLKSAYVLFKSKTSVITEVQLWDGAYPIQSFTKLQLTGDNSVRVGQANQFTVKTSFPITSGLGISVGVTFGNDGTQGSRPMGEIMFTGAGVFYE